jgi:L-ascorbate metabolism protein UlaG (beta-lactamase superfamily)
MNKYGAKATEADITKYRKSKNWVDGKFHNIEYTPMKMSLSKIPGILFKQIFKTKNRSPKTKIPVLPFDKNKFFERSDVTRFIWYGHSAILLRINNKTVFIDPMLGSSASPIKLFPVKRFSENTLFIIDELPTIDLVLLSHDHYDHLDFKSILKLKDKTKHFYVALGVARHLESWGIDKNKITEFDWWDSKTFEDIGITFTPSRHFSGRKISDRFKSLWGGWAINSGKEKIYFSGDSGYAELFKEVGKKLGPFDIGFMECGQYNENWHNIHMFPEESVQSAIDAKVNVSVPVHWGAFSLSLHSWTEPAERFSNYAEKFGHKTIFPAIGKVFTVSDSLKDKWWKNIN